MAHTIVGKLNKTANEIPTQNGTGFGIRLGVQYYDRETKKKECCCSFVEMALQ